MTRLGSAIGFLVLTVGVWAEPAVAQSELCANVDGYAATACRLYCDALRCDEGEDDAQCRRLAAGYERATGNAPPCGTCRYPDGDGLLCDFGLAPADAMAQVVGNVNADLNLDQTTTSFDPTPANGGPACSRSPQRSPTPRTRPSSRSSSRSSS